MDIRINILIQYIKNELGYSSWKILKTAESVQNYEINDHLFATPEKNKNSY